MKCPKCSYIGFEESDRCRHCGYEFSLIGAGPGDAVPAPLRASDTGSTPPYREPPGRAAAAADPAASLAAPLLDLPLTAPVGGPASWPTPALEPPGLPASLFAEPPPPARTPLAVRRTAERPRSRATPHVMRRPRAVLIETQDDVMPAAPASTDTATVAAPPFARVTSVVVDLALLVAIDAAVVYLTAQIANVPVSHVTSLPLVPLGAFIVGLNVAYLTVFTANGGQTLGKMATGLRVEATDGALTFGSAVVRVVAAIAGGLAMGIGFMPALVRADRRAVHDQIAHTRVVKVGA